MGIESSNLSTHCSEERHTAENLPWDRKETECKWGINSCSIYVHKNATNVTETPKLMETQRSGIGCLVSQ